MNPNSNFKPVGAPAPATGYMPAQPFGNKVTDVITNEILGNVIGGNTSSGTVFGNSYPSYNSGYGPSDGRGVTQVYNGDRSNAGRYSRD
jgi:hypothetical protein